MSDIQSKLGEGLSILQGGIEQGKEMLKTSQELVNLRKTLDDHLSLKSKLLLELGLQTYQKLRQEQIDKTLFGNSMDEMIQLDKKIFYVIKNINESTKKEGHSASCTCGAVLNKTDKFCGGCGKKIELAEESLPKETKTCAMCETEVGIEDHYCNCCGKKLPV